MMKNAFYWEAILKKPWIENMQKVHAAHESCNCLVVKALYFLNPLVSTRLLKVC